MKADEGVVSRRYARAAMGFCDSHGGHDAFAEGLAKIVACLEAVPLLETLLNTPVLNKEEKVKVVEAVADTMKLTETVRRFALILVGRKRMEYVGSILARFREMLDDQRGLVRGDVSTPVAIDEQMQRNLAVTLSGYFRKQVICSFHVDESLYGGVFARVGNTVIDSSIRGKLDRVRKKISTLTS